MTSPAPRSIRVMQSFSFGGTRTNPYLTELVRSLPDSIVSLPFSWRTAILGRYDVLHLHWPEFLFRRPSIVKETGRRILLLLLLVRIRLSPSVLVRTVHNTTPHEAGRRGEAALLSAVDNSTSHFILLNPTTPVPTRKPHSVIVHGDYRGVYETLPRADPVRGRLANFGLIRPYKGLEQLIDAFKQVPGDATLRILGHSSSPDLARNLRERAMADHRIGFRMEFIDDPALALELSSAELVILPYTAMHNSGAVLLALSLNRPVLVPQTETTVLLREEVGRGWVSLFTGELRGSDIERALKDSRGSDTTSGPDLTHREWRRLGLLTETTYRQALRAQG